MISSDVIIIGGGLQGCSTALHLVRKKKSVTLLEKATAGRFASGVNAGGVRRLNRAVEEIPLSRASLELWNDIASLVDCDCGFRPTGQVRVAENPLEMSILEDRGRLMTSLGYTHEEILGEKDLRRLVPAISDHCVGGLWCRRDGAAEPYMTTRAFFNKARQLGAAVYEHHPAASIERTDGRWRVRAAGRNFSAPVIVNCAGAWGDRIAAMIGDVVPLVPEALSMMVTVRVPPFLSPVVGLVARRLSFKQMPNGTVVIGGGHISKLDMANERTVIDFTQLTVSARTVRDLFPLMRQVPIARCWAGIEGTMPDSLPVIGPSPKNPEAFHAFGFSGHGFQLGPIVGRIMAELILDGKSTLPIDAFRVDRFPASEHKPSELPVSICMRQRDNSIL